MYTLCQSMQVFKFNCVSFRADPTHTNNLDLPKRARLYNTERDSLGKFLTFTLRPQSEATIDKPHFMPNFCIFLQDGYIHTYNKG